MTSSLARSGIERLGHPADVGQVDQQVEGDDRRQHEDDPDVEHPQAELAGPVELLLEASVVRAAEASRPSSSQRGIWTASRSRPTARRGR